MVSMEQAKKSVREFLSAIDRDAGFEHHRIDALLGAPTEEDSPNVGPLWTFESPFGGVSVSRRSGEVVSYEAPEAETTGASRVGTQAAEAAALTFIRSVYRDFDKRNFKLVERQETEDAFEFEYQEEASKPETSIFENFISVSVSADRGRVTSYSCSNLAFKRATTPRITESEARRIIEGIIAPYKGVIEELELTEEPVEGASRSVTVWSASVLYRAESETAADRIVINADTGERMDLP
jgi:hypothetical protein